MPRCIIIAGPNGAGKTTFARRYLPAQGIRHFVNADLIAAGISPLDPSAARVAAGRLTLSELERLVAAREDFAFESTLSGVTYAHRLKRWKQSGYVVEMVYLKPVSASVSIQRVASRVLSGGHDVPEEDIRRRFDRSWENFQSHYRQLAESWSVFDVTGTSLILLEKHP